MSLHISTGACYVDLDLIDDETGYYKRELANVTLTEAMSAFVQAFDNDFYPNLILPLDQR